MDLIDETQVNPGVGPMNISKSIYDDVVERHRQAEESGQLQHRPTKGEQAVLLQHKINMIIAYAIENLLGKMVHAGPGSIWSEPRSILPAGVTSQKSTIGDVKVNVGGKDPEQHQVVYGVTQGKLDVFRFHAPIFVQVRDTERWFNCAPGLEIAETPTFWAPVPAPLLEDLYIDNDYKWAGI